MEPPQMYLELRAFINFFRQRTPPETTRVTGDPDQIHRKENERIDQEP